MATIDVSHETEDNSDSDNQNNNEISDIDPRKKIYKKLPENPNDPLPFEFCHVRSGERLVQDKFYLAAADLVGEGLSVRESLKAIEIVSNRCFGRHFKTWDDIDGKEYNQDTLPCITSV